MEDLNNKDKLNVECCDSIKIENLENILNNANNLIANCDGKASAVVAWTGVLISILLVTGFIDKFIFVASLMVNSGNLWSAIYLFVMTIAMLVFGVNFCFIVLPLLIKNDGKNKTITHSNSILDPLVIPIDKSAEEYLNVVGKTTVEEYKKDLVRQIYKTSVLYHEKMNRYKANVTGVVRSFLVLFVMASVAVLWFGKM